MIDGEFVVPRDPGFFGGFEGVDVSAVEGDPELCDAISGCVVHMVIVVSDSRIVNTLINP